MDIRQEFFRNYLRALPLALSVKRRSQRLIRLFKVCDPLYKMGQEVSFKIQNGCLIPSARIFILDDTAYSGRSTFNFLLMSHLYRHVIGKKIRNPLLPSLFDAVSQMAKRPMGMWFGADVSARQYLFSLGLIFNREEAATQAVLWPRDFRKSVFALWEALNYLAPPFLNNRMRGVAFDVSNQELLFKVLYLFDDNERGDSPCMRFLGNAYVHLEEVGYRRFFTALYDQRGRCVRKKFFVELNEYISCGHEKMEFVLQRALRAVHCRFPLAKLKKAIDVTQGRLNIIGFESKGDVTFYLREPQFFRQKNNHCRA